MSSDPTDPERSFTFPGTCMVCGHPKGDEPCNQYGNDPHHWMHVRCNQESCVHPGPSRWHWFEPEQAFCCRTCGKAMLVPAELDSLRSQLAVAEQARESLIGGMRVASSEWLSERQKRFRAEVDLTAAQGRIAELERALRTIANRALEMSDETETGSQHDRDALELRMVALDAVLKPPPQPPAAAFPMVADPTVPAGVVYMARNPPAAAIDPRPFCIRCGQRWVPPEGVDATVTACFECDEKPSPAQADSVCEHLVNRIATDCSLCDAAESDSVGAGGGECSEDAALSFASDFGSHRVGPAEDE